MDEDREFLRRFEAATLREDEFGHVEHVRMAWLYLRAHPLAEALIRIRDGIRHFAAIHGASGLYHETITVAYALLIASRLGEVEDGGEGEGEGDWQAFRGANPDLFEPGLAVLLRHYEKDTLRSARAKRHFVWPDR